MPVDFDALLNNPMLDVFGEDAVYTPVRSAPLSPAFVIKGSFERHHSVVLDEIARSEMKAPGHSTTVPVLTVRLAAFSALPKQNDKVAVRGETYFVYDIQPDGEGCADLVLREYIP